jgi:hypothetical protein
MKRKLNTTLGFYSPSFLRMHVGTKKSLMNLNTLNDDFAESIYLHEYCHFIQDISTTYGLINLCTIVDYMKFANNHVINLSMGNFSVPVLPIPNAPDNVHANLELFSIYKGSGEDHNVTLTGHRKLNATVQSNSNNLNVPYIEIDYTVNGVANTFKFGALCIVETMAYIIESECYPNCCPPPDLPYTAAEKLVDLIYPKFGNDRLNVLALCDASLKHPNPGSFFYDALLRIKTNNTAINQPEDVYQICNQATINFNGEATFNQLLLIMGRDAISQIQGYFNAPRFQPLKDWLENTINKAVDFRIQNETFPLDIARSGKIAVNNDLAAFMTNVGTPLVTNEIGETTLSDPRYNSITPNYSTIWAIDQIHSVFWGCQTHCELVGLCCSSGINTDMRCTNEPWERNLEPTCAFGQMWRHWGLTGYVPN